MCKAKYDSAKFGTDKSGLEIKVSLVADHVALNIGDDLDGFMSWHRSFWSTRGLL